MVEIIMNQIKPYKINGTINAVASKSYLQRALAIACLAQGESVIKNFYPSDDALVAKKILQNFGTEISGVKNLKIVPKPFFDKENLKIYVGESGLCLRIFSFVATLISHETEVMGAGTLLKRPIAPLIEYLQKCGVSAKTTNGSLPIFIKGQIKNKKIEIDGSFSSQMLSGLLIVAPLLKHNTEIIVHNLTSKNYVSVTIDVMRHFGVEVENNDFKRFYIKGNQKYIACNYTVEGDWSAAANLLVGAAISGQITIKGLNKNSLQPDSKIYEILKDFGAEITWKNGSISVCKNTLTPIKTDLSESPDLFPPVVVLAASAKGLSVIKGTHRLIHKESNRLQAILSAFTKMGLQIENKEDTLFINGSGTLNGATIDSFDDHRIVMCAAIARIIAKGDIILNSINAVNKSYPTFFKDLKKISE
ncbi:MAG: 3-phosphoshikimate 1-carboxyvinyltransferase [Bacteroidales bacterium]|nr:3-phosphoshikimate 1-carboxyvinyltransferase [Bacteroidales bacterium]